MQIRGNGSVVRVMVRGGGSKRIAASFWLFVGSKVVHGFSCDCFDLDGGGYVGHLGHVTSPLPGTPLITQQQQQQCTGGGATNVLQQQNAHTHHHDPAYGTGLSTPPGGGLPPMAESPNTTTRMSPPMKADTPLSASLRTAAASSLTLLQPISATATSYTLPSLAPYPSGEYHGPSHQSVQWTDVPYPPLPVHFTQIALF